jgi:GNAT superfamily N-acetyltransferase
VLPCSDITRPFEMRRLVAADVADALKLLSRCFGGGFGHVDLERPGINLVAWVDPDLVGVITVASCTSADLEATYAGRVSWPNASNSRKPLALISQIAVDPAWRGRGIGDALLSAGEQAVSSWDLDYLVVNAWVHARTGLCPASRLLARGGYHPAGFVPDFFVNIPGTDGCPGCLSTPCTCGVRVYFKQTDRGGASLGAQP